MDLANNCAHLSSQAYRHCSNRGCDSRSRRLTAAMFIERSAFRHSAGFGASHCGTVSLVIAPEDLSHQLATRRTVSMSRPATGNRHRYGE